MKGKIQNMEICLKIGVASINQMMIESLEMV